MKVESSLAMDTQTTSADRLRAMDDDAFWRAWPGINQDAQQRAQLSPTDIAEFVGRAVNLSPHVAASVKDAAQKAPKKKLTAALDCVQLIRGDAIEPVAIRWLWDGFLARGKITIIAGAPGSGKTTLCLSMAATISCGGRWPDARRAESGNVLIWTGEDDPADTLVPRLVAMGANMERIFFINRTVENGTLYPFDPSRDMDLLTLKAAEIGDVSLVLIDPIVSAVAGDSHKNSETRRGLQPVVDLADRLNCAVLGVSHYSKGTQGKDPLERVTGSLAFGAVARVVLGTCKGKEGAKRRLVRCKSNIGPDGGGFEYDLQLEPVPGHDLTASTVLWCGALEGDARDLLADSENDKSETPENEVTGWLRTLLTEEAGGLEKTEVMKAARANGFAERTVQRARERLGVLVHLTGFGKAKRSVWTLPAINATFPQH